jgi:hypothetical protein
MLETGQPKPPLDEAGRFVEGRMISDVAAEPSRANHVVSGEVEVLFTRQKNPMEDTRMAMPMMSA